MPKKVNRQLRPVSVRLSEEMWRRCESVADERGQSRSEFVRATLAKATRNAKPEQASWSIALSDEEWAISGQFAEKVGVSREDIFRRLLNRAAEVGPEQAGEELYLECFGSAEDCAEQAKVTNL